MRRTRTGPGALVVALVLSAALGRAEAAQLTWWSHWAVEDSKKAVLFEVKKRFEARNPGNTVELTFYEKKNMWPALRAAFTAGWCSISITKRLGRWIVDGPSRPSSMVGNSRYSSSSARVHAT